MSYRSLISWWRMKFNLFLRVHVFVNNSRSHILASVLMLVFVYNGWVDNKNNCNFHQIRINNNNKCEHVYLAESIVRAAFLIPRINSLVEWKYYKFVSLNTGQHAHFIACQGRPDRAHVYFPVIFILEQRTAFRVIFKREKEMTWKSHLGIAIDIQMFCFCVEWNKLASSCMKWW